MFLSGLQNTLAGKHNCMKTEMLMDRGCMVVSENETVFQAAKRMSEEELDIIPVLDNQLNLLGIVSSKDLVAGILAKEINPKEVFIGSLVSPAVTVGIQDDVETAASKLDRSGLSSLLVLDKQGRIAGTISRRSVKDLNQMAF